MATPWRPSRHKRSGHRSRTISPFGCEEPSFAYRACSRGQNETFFADREAKHKWFGSPGECEIIEEKFDFRVGGQERARGKWKSGTISDFEATYLDIVPLERIAYAYVMHLDANKISASLATIEFKKHDNGTKIIMTEQGAFFDGYDDAGGRKRGTEYLLEAVGKSLET